MTRVDIKVIIKIIFLFIVSYLLFAFLWIQVKDSYSYIITLLSSKITAGIKNAYMENIIKDKDIIYTYFSTLFDKRRMIFTVSIPTYIYTSNVPMTIAIMICMFFFIDRKFRAYSEAVVILILTHLFYSVTFISMQLTTAYMSKGIESINHLKITFYQFLWGFSDYMFIRFGPFFIGLYIYLRFKNANIKHS
jgi:hypothetical protein